jgi:hypothetical protein
MSKAKNYAVIDSARFVDLTDNLGEALERLEELHARGRVVTLYHGAKDDLLAEVDVLRGHLRKIVGTFYEFSDDPAAVSSYLGELIEDAEAHLNKRLAQADIH